MVGESIMKKPQTRRKREPDEALEDDTDEDLFEFTDLGPHLTGLPFFVWVRPSMGLRREVWVGVSPDRNCWGGSDLIHPRRDDDLDPLDDDEDDADEDEDDLDDDEDDEDDRSEERRVGKEGRSRWAPYH